MADLLIGAEGAHSRVREYLLGAEKAALEPLPLMGCAALTTLPADLAVLIREKYNRLYVVNYHPSGMVAFTACKLFHHLKYDLKG